MRAQSVIYAYLAQAYSALIGIIIIPVYIKVLGAEALGLIGFTSALLIALNIFDVGLTQVIARESSRSGIRRQTTVPHKFLRTIATLRVLNQRTAVALTIATAVAGPALLSTWGPKTELPKSHIICSLLAVSLSITARWRSAFYRGILTGAEELPLVSKINITIATIKGPLAIFAVWVVGGTVCMLFVSQLAVAEIEAYWLKLETKKIVDLKQLSSAQKFNLQEAREHLALGLKIGYASLVSTVTTQVDKILLISNIQLEQYGHYTAATALASGVGLMFLPITQVIMPRLTSIASLQSNRETHIYYKNASRLTILIVGVPALILAAYPEEILDKWTGNPAIAENSYKVLRNYALANMISAISGCAYMLQYAKGTLNNHMKGSTALMLASPAAYYLGIKASGEAGLSVAVLTVNLVYLVVWITKTHKELLSKKEAIEWLIEIINTLALPGCVIIASTLGYSTKGNTLYLKLLAVTIAAYASGFLLYYLRKSNRSAP